MVTRIIGFALCLLAGLLTGYAARALLQPTAPAAPQEPTAPSSSLLILEQEKARLLTRLESQERRIAELEQDRERLRQELAAKQAPVQPSSSRDGVQDIIQAGLRLADRHATLRQNRILDEIGFSAAQRAELARRLPKPEGNPMEALAQQSVAFAQALHQLATPEQKKALARFEQEEQRVQAEMMAHAEFTQLRMAIKLAPEQEDAVFQALADYHLSRAEYQGSHRKSGQQAGGDREGTVVEFEPSQESKHELLAKVLTSDQMKAYQAMVEQNRSMMREMMGLFGRQQGANDSPAD